MIAAPAPAATPPPAKVAKPIRWPVAVDVFVTSDAGHQRVATFPLDVETFKPPVLGKWYVQPLERTITSAEVLAVINSAKREGVPGLSLAESRPST